jgi:hypothetical protein
LFVFKKYILTEKNRKLDTQKIEKQGLYREKQKVIQVSEFAYILPF